MARENQGLQIALIVFVLLTIILGVTTFYFYRSYDEANIKAAAAVKSEGDMRTKMDASQSENAQLRGFLGVPAADTTDTISKQLPMELERHLASVPAAERSFRKTVATLDAALQKRSAELKTEKESNLALNDKLATREAVNKPKIDAPMAEAKKARDDLADQTKNYNENRSTLEKTQKDLLAKGGELQKQAKAAEAKRVASVEKASQELKDVVGRNQELAGQIQSLTRATFEVPSGNIEWVNQRGRSVWINLGSADNLKPLTTFSVYEAKTMDVSKTAKKGSLEVTAILGPHQAEARVVEDIIGNPILVGDVIYTPLWQPGEKKRFAIAGFIDFDNDGKADLRRLISLIETTGGVIDCYRDETGLHGGISAQTGYLILGTAPTEKSTAEERKEYTKQREQAHTFSLKEITVREFLNMTGYKPERRVQSYGPGADPRQFELAPNPGAAKKSTGRVSPLYEKSQRDTRTPPGIKADEAAR